MSDVVDGLDLRAFYERYEGDGRRKSPYEPRMMLKALIYGYATGVFSSRRLAKKLEEEVAFRVLGAGNFLRTGQPEGAAGRPAKLSELRGLCGHESLQ